LKTALEPASVLAFERKLDPSDGIFLGGQWNNRKELSNWEPIKIREKSVRGTISNRLSAKESDPAKIDAKIQNANLQTVDIASLGPNADTLNVQFSLRVLPGVGTPSACNDSDYQARVAEIISDYIKQNGLSELASRYATNLANGRFLWRNRLGAENIEINITARSRGNTDCHLSFDAYSLSMKSFDNISIKELSELSKLIEAGLLGKESILLSISAFVQMGKGLEVFPSQELILLDKSKGKEREKSKTLYNVSDIAAMHSQKIGNALRTIDTWYPSAKENGPIAVEPYGSVTSQGSAFRQPKDKVDFYSLLDNWIIKDKAPSLENQHYVVAMIIRGGVFG